MERILVAGYQSVKGQVGKDSDETTSRYPELTRTSVLDGWDVVFCIRASASLVKIFFYVYVW